MIRSQVLRIDKLTATNQLKMAAQHNLRELQAENGAASHIYVDRSNLNKILAGPVTADEVASLSKNLLANAGIKSLRKDAVRAVEIVISLPPRSSINQPSFFGDCLAWVQTYFNVPILSAIVHNDEAAPHCHFLLLPLVSGRMQGSGLVGNRTRLQALQADFHAQVAGKYGLHRKTRPNRVSAPVRRRVAAEVVALMKSRHGLDCPPELSDALLDTFAENPDHVMQALEMNIRDFISTKGTFVSIMTKACRPDTETI